MPRSRPKCQDAKQDTKLEESPLEILRKKVFKYLNSRLGWPVAAVVVAAVGVWVGWDAVSKVPGIDWALMKGHELLPVPKARGDRFSIVIPRLENDPEGIHRRLISDALRSQFSKDEVEVLLMERSIPIEQSARPQEEVRKGHDVARDLLRATKGNVMIWGEAGCEAGCPVASTLDAQFGCRCREDHRQIPPLCGKLRFAGIIHKRFACRFELARHK
jgi:hypothetical protein